MLKKVTIIVIAALASGAYVLAGAMPLVQQTTGV